MIEAECHHHLDQNSFTKSLQGRKIYKDQCVRCFSDAVNAFLFRHIPMDYLCV